MIRIAIVATGAHALPSPSFTGDSQIIIDLCIALTELGHWVTLLAPKGTVSPPGVRLCEDLPVGAGFEEACADVGQLLAMSNTVDVFHDFSIGKTVHGQCSRHGFPSISTILGGCAYKPLRNTVVWSEAMRDRVMRGATDYEGTQWPDKGGQQCEPFKDVRVVHGGVDTEFYSPGPPDQVGDHYLWLSRWSPEKGPLEAVELAKATGIELVMAGLSPEALPPAEGRIAAKCLQAAQGFSNISFQWLAPGAGHHEAKRELLRQARCFLAPLQFQEPFGLGMVEAMACGTPVIATRMGSARELIGGGLTLVGMKEQALENRGPFEPLDKWRAQKRRKAARKRAVRMFDRKVMAMNYVRLYEEVCGGGGWG